MIERDLAPRLRAAARKFPAVTLTGPRQSGKSTLCRNLFPKKAYVSLESPDIRAFALEDPRAFLAQYPRGAILDEIQRCPNLPSYLQWIIDARPTAGRWILTGSHSLTLNESVSQSLAGRTAVLHLLPLSRNEVRRFPRPPATLEQAIISGGYPRIFDKMLRPQDWIAGYVRTYIERDVRSVSNVGDLTVFQRFIQLCAGRTAQLLNLSALATDCGVSQPTIKAWLSVLETTFIAFRLLPFSGNIRKRLVKSPKLHFYDTGLVCWLLGIRSAEQLRTHPLRGAIFETWAVSEILKHRMNRGESAGLYFYRDQHGIEADLVVETPKKLLVVEAKAAATVSGDMVGAGGAASSALAAYGNTERRVVFGGEAPQHREHVSLIPWDDVDANAW